MPGYDRYDPIGEARRRFGGELRRLRKDAGLTQEALAAAIGSKNTTVSDLERGVGARPPNLELVTGYVDECLRAIGGATAIRDTRRAILLEQCRNLETWIGYDTENRRQFQNMSTSGMRVANMLPRDVPRFVGRNEELNLLTAASITRSGPIPVHVVEGMPGVGKSAFAIYAARRLGEHFPDGQLYVPIHAHSPGRSVVDPSDALAGLLALDGVEQAAIPAGLDARAALWRYRTASRRQVMVIDDVSTFAQAEPLLPGGDGSLVIVTSRIRLGAPDCVPVELTTLTVAEADDLFRTIAGRRLADADDVGELVERCGSLPLAIGIVAGWRTAHRSVPVKELLDQMDAAGLHPHNVRDGNRTVAAAFDLSYRSMTEDRQGFFRTLCLNAGRDIDAYAAAALSGTSVPAARTHLESLYDHHLLDEPTLGRYQMHDLVAGYGAELAAAEPGLREPLARLAGYYKATATVADGWLTWPPSDGPVNAAEDSTIVDRRTAVGWLRAERGNIIATLHALSRAGLSEHVVALAAACAEFLRQYGPWDQAVQIHRLAVGAATASGDRVGKARALRMLGEIQRLTDEYESSKESLTAALAINVEVGAVGEETFTRIALGTVLWLLGDYGASSDDLVTALESARASGDRRAEAAALAELGTLRMMTDHYADACDLLAAAAALCEDLGNRLGTATALKTLGFTLYLSDRYAESRDASSRALTIFNELDYPTGRAQVFVNLGGVMRLSGDYEPAEEALDQAIALFREMNKISSAAQAMSELGALQGSTGRPELGERTLRTAVAMSEAVNDRLGLPAALNQLGEVLRIMGRLAEADSVLVRAEELYKALDDQLGLAAVANVRGAVLLDAGNAAAAHDQYETGLRHAQAIANPLEEGLAHEGLGRAAHALGAHDAIASLRRAGEILSGIGAVEAIRVAALLRELDR